MKYLAFDWSEDIEPTLEDAVAAIKSDDMLTLDISFGIQSMFDESSKPAGPRSYLVRAL